MKLNVPSAKPFQSLASGNKRSLAVNLDFLNQWSYIFFDAGIVAKCTNVGLCQNCYWTQLGPKNHKPTHPTREYCLAVSITQYDLFNSFRKAISVLICLSSHDIYCGF